MNFLCVFPLPRSGKRLLCANFCYSDSHHEPNPRFILANVILHSRLSRQWSRTLGQASMTCSLLRSRVAAYAARLVPSGTAFTTSLSLSSGVREARAEHHLFSVYSTLPRSHLHSCHGSPLRTHLLIEAQRSARRPRARRSCSTIRAPACFNHVPLALASFSPKA